MQKNSQWCGWKCHEFAWIRVSAWIKFVGGTIPPPSDNFGIKIHGAVYNDWLKDCRADEWCFVSAGGRSMPGRDANHILLIFDTMGGPREVHVKELKGEIYLENPERIELLGSPVRVMGPPSIDSFRFVPGALAAVEDQDQEGLPAGSSESREYLDEHGVRTTAALWSTAACHRPRA